MTRCWDVVCLSHDSHRGVPKPATATAHLHHCPFFCMNQVGDLQNHSGVDPTVTMAAAFCMTAIELCELLIQDLG